MSPPDVRNCASNPLSLRTVPSSAAPRASGRGGGPRLRRPRVAGGRRHCGGQLLEVGDERRQLLVRNLDPGHAPRRHPLGDDARQLLRSARIQRREDRSGAVAAGGVPAVAQRATGPVRLLAVSRGEVHHREQENGNQGWDSHAPAMMRRRLSAIAAIPNVLSPGPAARASTRRSSDVVLGDPLAKRRVDARLPSATAGLEVLDHVRRKPDGGRYLRIGARWPASADGRLGEFLRPAIGGEVRSDVVFRTWGRRAFVPFHLAFLMLMTRCAPSRGVQDENHHRGVEETRSAQFMLLQQIEFPPGSDLGTTTGAIRSRRRNLPSCRRSALLLQGRRRKRARAGPYTGPRHPHGWVSSTARRGTRRGDSVTVPFIVADRSPCSGPGRGCRA